MTKPHESTQPEAGYLLTANKRTIRVTAFLSLYQVDRCCGGPEEGGWYYDTYQFLRVSFPFSAEQDYETAEVTEDTDDETQSWENPDGLYYCWHPTDLPRVTDERTRVLLESFRSHVGELYKLDGRERFSAGQREDDYVLRYEYRPGEHETKKRPRYE